MQANMTRPYRPIALKIAVSLCVLGAIVGDAQQPTKAQEAAIRSACQADFASVLLRGQTRRLCGIVLPAAECRLAVSRLPNGGEQSSHCPPRI